VPSGDFAARRAKGAPQSTGTGSARKASARKASAGKASAGTGAAQEPAAHGADERGASIGASVGASVGTSVIGATVAGTSVPGARGLRRALLAVMLLGCALGMARRGAAQEPEPPRLSATLSCPPRAGQGRIVCELHLEAPSGHRLRWA